MSSVLWTVLAVAVCVGMLVVARRIEPHWLSKDRRRFLTTCEEIDRLGTVIGRRREVRGMITDDGRIMLTQRSFMRSTSIVFRIHAKSPRPPSGKALYVMQPVPPAADGGQLVLRMPARSELVAILDALPGGPTAEPGDTTGDGDASSGGDDDQRSAT